MYGHPTCINSENTPPRSPAGKAPLLQSYDQRSETSAHHGGTLDSLEAAAPPVKARPRPRQGIRASVLEWWNTTVFGLDETQAIDPAAAYLLEGPSFPPLFVWPPIWLVVVAVIGTAWIVLSCTVFRHQLAAVTKGVLDCPDGADGSPDEGCAVRSFLEYVSIPLLCLGFTYVHIWLALWMMFFPVNYLGVLKIPGTNFGLGWQAIHTLPYHKGGNLDWLCYAVLRHATGRASLRTSGR